MIWELIVFIIAFLTCLTLIKTPKIEVPSELRAMEEEIRAWLERTRIRPVEEFGVPLSHAEILFFEELGVTRERLATYNPEMAPHVWIIGEKREIEEIRVFLKTFRPYNPLLLPKAVKEG